ncbi:hypothetical protein AnigIFM60653_001747 [Aspergillus niger]|uniref:F-box domain-containing protein n=2 Tax=Aspergillus TaxID=5052 RepID=A0A3F3PZQ6_9EURO|nr:hypothetical protein BDQ94DRAFT_179347 [Aspergillus welwitschiae]RDH32398.1 hypothetical protein BDQ94DRAFT_179347 [Aspergillus welwitschiae]GKZ57414.1 hypothetical protein AnigIFM49718_002724 [Aspergillus niger]GLA02344.1 hypothetical protein AnigIFM60653_001747 [Aspergillus niger]GLA17529.1 hypothetical protein AnigIFM62618_004669 [Aspergillus niger]
MHDLFLGKSNYPGDSFTTLIMHSFSQSSPMPTEVIIRIFGELTLPDALHLAATCRRLRQVMKENTPAIYRRLRRQIPCERYARVVLADQGGPPPYSSSSMTIADLLRLRRNSRVVEKAIEVFDRDITAHIRISLKSIDDQFYGGNPRPLSLTPTERHRFTRSYYQVWSLLLLNQRSRQKRYQNMLLKHLYMIYEMTDLDQPIGDESRSFPADEKRCELLQEVSEYLRDLYHNIHGVDYIDFSGQSVSMRTQGHAAIWDHCQPDFKKIVCYQWRDPEKKPVQEEEVWEHTTDEE